jgi:hypothetical protein
MKQKIGFAAFILGLVGAVGAAGGITALPPEATVVDVVQLVGIGFTCAMLMQMGIWMFKEEI